MSARQLVPLSFFARGAAQVARDLIGVTLVRVTPQGTRRCVIVETEAYEGVHDLASHSSKGRTARTEVMFGPAGRFYIYRIYGLHWMLNVVTGNVDEGSAVLIRGVQGMSGPGRVTASLEIDASLHARRARRDAGLWFEVVTGSKAVRVQRTPRIGVDYAGTFWAAKKLRFIMPSSANS